MKTLLVCCLLASAPAIGQTVPKGAIEATQPFRKANVILVHSADSAAVAYNKAVTGLLVSGFALDRSDPAAMFVSTPAKPLGPALSLRLNVHVTPAPGGSIVAYRGLFSMVNVATLMAKVDKRELPVQYFGEGAGAAGKLWAEMRRAASAAYPALPLFYIQMP